MATLSTMAKWPLFFINTGEKCKRTFLYNCFDAWERPWKGEYFMIFKVLDLQFFADGGDGGTGTANEAGATGAEINPSDAGKDERAKLATVRYGKPDTEEAANEVQDAAEHVEKDETPPDRNAEFEKLIKGEYKDIFDDRVQTILKERWKNTKILEDTVNKVTPVLEMIAKKYGVAANDYDKLLAAVEDDNALYEADAAREGMSVDQYKLIKKSENETERLRKELAKQQREKEIQQKFQLLQQQGEAAKKVYPNFDLKTEMSHPETGKQFTQLIHNGIDAKTAYEVIHKDDLYGGAMQYAAQQTAQKVVNNIQSRASRPVENGVNAQSGIVTKTDPEQFTKADLAEIRRRVARGEKIKL